MKIMLRPQWSLQDIGAKLSLVSETFSFDVEEQYLELVKRLATGLYTEDLTDDEFDAVEVLNARGILTFVDDPDAPFWELSGADFYTVSAQLKHVTFKVIDLTHNRLGQEVRETLLESGVSEADDPKLTIILADSYRDVPEQSGVVIPIICNRMKLQFGPLLFPWGTSVCDVVNANKLFLERPSYKLPAAFDKLQRAWISMMLVRLIAFNRFGCYKNMVEYNLGTQEFKSWPVTFE